MKEMAGLQGLLDRLARDAERELAWQMDALIMWGSTDYKIQAMNAGNWFALRNKSPFPDVWSIRPHIDWNMVVAPRLTRTIDFYHKWRTRFRNAWYTLKGVY